MTDRWIADEATLGEAAQQFEDCISTARGELEVVDMIEQIRQTREAVREAYKVLARWRRKAMRDEAKR